MAFRNEIHPYSGGRAAGPRYSTTNPFVTNFPAVPRPSFGLFGRNHRGNAWTDPPGEMESSIPAFYVRRFDYVLIIAANFTITGLGSVVGDSLATDFSIARGERRSSSAGVIQ